MGRRPGAVLRGLDPEGHAQALVVEGSQASQVAGADVLAMVGGIDDQGGIQEAQAVQAGKEAVLVAVEQVHGGAVPLAGEDGHGRGGGAAVERGMGDVELDHAEEGLLARGGAQVMQQGVHHQAVVDAEVVHQGLREVAAVDGDVEVAVDEVFVEMLPAPVLGGEEEGMVAQALGVVPEGGVPMEVVGAGFGRQAGGQARHRGIGGAGIGVGAGEDPVLAVRHHAAGTGAGSGYPGSLPTASPGAGWRRRAGTRSG